MDRDIGRGRHGREISKVHASTRLKGLAPAPKRERDRQGQHLVQGTHDGEAEQDLAQQQPPPPPPQQASPQNEVQVYGGGPHDLSLLTEYHKHRAIRIWDANRNNHDVS
ncbi:hypothetical protein P8452_42322 [Trifolium repens]|nr:hypothetical protein P8452_42322 [Trifolium repens]